MSVLGPVFRYLSPGGRRARLSILIFHRVLSAPDPLFPDLPDAARFRELLRWLQSWLNVLPLDDAVRKLAAGTLPERAAAITFDDGYADNFTVALPLLRERGLSATFFIATGFLDGGRMWNDTIIEAVRLCRLPALALDDCGLGRHDLSTAHARRLAIDALTDRIKYLPDSQRQALAARIVTSASVVPPNELMMTSSQVRELRRAGMLIGAHTVSHPMLTKLEITHARQEIVEGKARLEALLGERLGLFAYPNGKFPEDYVAAHVALVRDIGFDAAVTTNWGAAATGDDLLQLPRFTPWDEGRLRFGARLALNLAGSRRRVS